MEFDAYFHALERAAAFVKLERVRPIDVGWDNFVLEVNGEWIFRFPRGAEARARLSAELALLTVLAPELPAPVPVCEWVGHANEDGLPDVAAYRRLAGRPLVATDFESPDLVAGLADFLRTLHGLKTVIERASPEVELERWRAHLRTLATECEQLVFTKLPEDRGAALRAQLHRILSQIESLEHPLAPVHGDLRAAHVLVSEDPLRLSGVLDWGDAGIGDPAIDFAGFVPLLSGGSRAGAGLGELALQYDGGRDSSLLRRARLYASLVPHFELVHAAERGEALAR